MTEPDLAFDPEDPFAGDNAAILFTEQGMTFLQPSGVVGEGNAPEHVLMAGALFQFVVANQAWLMNLAFGMPSKSKLN